jgi:hypothetical protein
MSPLEHAIATASRKIAAFLEAECPALPPVREGLAGVAPFLPCTDPSDKERAALQEYRENLHTLQAGIERFSERLLERRAAVASKLRSVKVARTYQQFAGL